MRDTFKQTQMKCARSFTVFSSWVFRQLGSSTRIRSRVSSKEQTNKVFSFGRYNLQKMATTITAACNTPDTKDSIAMEKKGKESARQATAERLKKNERKKTKEQKEKSDEKVTKKEKKKEKKEKKETKEVQKKQQVKERERKATDQKEKADKGLERANKSLREKSKKAKHKERGVKAKEKQTKVKEKKNQIEQ